MSAKRLWSQIPFVLVFRVFENGSGFKNVSGKLGDFKVKLKLNSTHKIIILLNLTAKHIERFTVHRSALISVKTLITPIRGFQRVIKLRDLWI